MEQRITLAVWPPFGIRESAHQFGLAFDDVRGRSRKQQSSDGPFRNRNQPDSWVRGLGAVWRVYFTAKKNRMCPVPALSEISGDLVPAYSVTDFELPGLFAGHYVRPYVDRGAVAPMKAALERHHQCLFIRTLLEAVASATSQRE